MVSVLRACDFSFSPSDPAIRSPTFSIVSTESYRGYTYPGTFDLQTAELRRKTDSVLKLSSIASSEGENTT